MDNYYAEYYERERLKLIKKIVTIEEEQKQCDLDIENIKNELSNLKSDDVRMYRIDNSIKSDEINDYIESFLQLQKRINAVESDFDVDLKDKKLNSNNFDIDDILMNISEDYIVNLFSETNSYSIKTINFLNIFLKFISNSKFYNPSDEKDIRGSLNNISTYFKMNNLLSSIYDFDKLVGELRINSCDFRVLNLIDKETILKENSNTIYLLDFYETLLLNCLKKVIDYTDYIYGLKQRIKELLDISLLKSEELRRLVVELKEYGN